MVQLLAYKARIDTRLAHTKACLFCSARVLINSMWLNATVVILCLTSLFWRAVLIPERLCNSRRLCKCGAVCHRRRSWRRAAGSVCRLRGGRDGCVGGHAKFFSWVRPFKPETRSETGCQLRSCQEYARGFFSGALRSARNQRAHKTTEPGAAQRQRRRVQNEPRRTRHDNLFFN